jgi:AcrR family transcriptional regulator
MPDRDTRSRILDAALSSFLKDGYEHTTVALIRERSGVSNGALFHHFPSKEAIADTLYLEAISSFQDGLWALVRTPASSLREAVRHTISHQLRWVQEHPDLARFVYSRGHLDWDTPGGARIADLNRELAGAYRKWLAPFVERGEIRARSMTIASAIVSGPAHSIAQRWLAGQINAPLDSFYDELADAAWAGLRGKPAPATAAPPQEALHGRVKLELLAGDGTVLAQAHSTAEFTTEPEGSPR